MKTVVILQARMGSERFPGKVLTHLGDVPMLVWILKRLGPLEREGMDIVVATTTNREDDAIENECHGRGVYCYRGSVTDVLSRYVDIGKDYDLIVRLTADSPLIWAGLVRWALDHRMGDYSFCRDLDGLDVQVYTKRGLERIEEMATTAYDHEHVCSSALPGHRMLGPKLSVDEPEDLQRVREFFQ